MAESTPSSLRTAVLVPFYYDERDDDGDEIEYAIDRSPYMGMKVEIPSKGIEGYLCQVYYKATEVWCLQIKTNDSQKSSIILTKHVGYEDLDYNRLFFEPFEGMAG